MTLDSAQSPGDRRRRALSMFVAWWGAFLVLWSGFSSLCAVGLFPPPAGTSTGSTSRCGGKRPLPRAGRSWGQRVRCFLLHARALRWARQRSPPSASFWGRWHLILSPGLRSLEPFFPSSLPQLFFHHHGFSFPSNSPAENETSSVLRAKPRRGFTSRMFVSQWLRCTF